MVKVSIACLIQKSTRWLQFVQDQVRKQTDLTDKEFQFVANDANEHVLNYLKDNNIPHQIHNNTEEQRKEWYINNVYRAWNTAMRVAKGEQIVLINSDMAFTPHWLERLQETIQDDRIVCSRLVERGVLRSGLYGIEKNFGNVPGDQKEAEFLQFAKDTEQYAMYPSGLQMPCLLKKEHAEKIGQYPEGNILTGSDIQNPIIPTEKPHGTPITSGDVIFMEKLRRMGVNHQTNFASIVQHFQEGEMRDTVSP